MFPVLVLLLAFLFPIASAQCTFCLPACTQPPFPGNICSSSVVLSVKAKVISNSATVCTSVCDGKGIALGNLKTIFDIKIEQVFKGPPITGIQLSVAGINTFATDPLRKGVDMQVGQSYFINLLSPMPAPIDDYLYIDRCDHPTLWTGSTTAPPDCS